MWHKGLTEKLKYYGLSESLDKWFQDYISNRKQIVFINNSESRIGLLKAGVPQGSVLDSLLFLIYINDISDHLSNLVRLFADDTSLSYSSTNLLQIERKLNSDMNILNTWAETWLVKFNPQKTEFVIFSNKKNIDQVNILFNGENIKQVVYHTHLGVCLSSNCIWCYHINNTCQRATKRIHILRKLKYLLSRSHLSKIYKTYSLPILEYGCELWDDCCIRDTQTLECLQLEAARIVTGLPIYSSAESLYFETG